MLSTPVKAYISFESAEAFERCQKHLFKYDTDSHKKNKLYQEMELFDEPAQLAAAPEPSNIIWENL